MFASAISVNRTSWHFPGRTSADNNTAPISPGPLVLQLLSRLFRCVHRISGAIPRFLPATTMPFRTASVSSPVSHTRSISRAFRVDPGILFQAKFRNAAEIFCIPLYCSAVNRLFSRLQKYPLLIIKRKSVKIICFDFQILRNMQYYFHFLHHHHYSLPIFLYFPFLKSNLI